MRIGILGGTFDPIHNGHMAMARSAIDEGVVDHVILVPNGAGFNHKRPVESMEHRLNMCVLTSFEHDDISVSSIELRDEPRYMYDTLCELKKYQYPTDELVVLIGPDIDITKWKNWYALRERFNIQQYMVDFGQAELSYTRSTDIRRLIPAAGGVRLLRHYLRNNTHPEVAEYIIQEGLYV